MSKYFDGEIITGHEDMLLTYSYEGNLNEFHKVIADLQSQLADKDYDIKVLNKALELAVYFIENVTGSCPYDSELITEQDKCVECTDDIKKCWYEYFKIKAKEMLENEHTL